MGPNSILGEVTKMKDLNDSGFHCTRYICETSYRSKCSDPIRLQDSLIVNISGRNGCISLNFLHEYIHPVEIASETITFYYYYYFQLLLYSLPGMAGTIPLYHFLRIHIDNPWISGWHLKKVTLMLTIDIKDVIFLPSSYAYLPQQFICQPQNIFSA